MYRNSSGQRGVALLEVLVAVLVLSIGMLGIAALQAMTLRNAGGAAERSMATIQVYSLLDVLRADKGHAFDYNTDGGFVCSVGGTTPARLNGWVNQLHGSLSASACGQVACEAVGTSTDCTISVRWDAARLTGGRIQREGEEAPAEGEESLQTLEIRTRL